MKDVAVVAYCGPVSRASRVARYLGSTLLELARRGRHRAIVGVCTAGGMSTAAYLERS